MGENISEKEKEEITYFIFAGRKIEAIKIYREKTNCGLKEAKDFVDSLSVKMEEQFPENFTKKSNSGCGTGIIVFLTILFYYIF